MYITSRPSSVVRSSSFVVRRSSSSVVRRRPSSVVVRRRPSSVVVRRPFVLRRPFVVRRRPSSVVIRRRRIMKLYRLRIQYVFSYLFELLFLPETGFKR